MKQVHVLCATLLLWLLAGSVLADDIRVPPGLKAPPAAQGVISAIHQEGKIVVQDILFNVDEHTRITGRYQQPLAFPSLRVGMRVRVHLRPGDGVRFYAARVEEMR